MQTQWEQSYHLLFGFLVQNEMTFRWLKIRWAISHRLHLRCTWEEHWALLTTAAPPTTSLVILQWADKQISAAVAAAHWDMSFEFDLGAARETVLLFTCLCLGSQYPVAVRVMRKGKWGRSHRRFRGEGEGRQCTPSPLVLLVLGSIMPSLQFAMFAEERFH